MRYFFGVILLSCLLSISYAQIPQDKKIKLLDQPSVNGKVVKMVTPWQRLIPFYRQRGWLKVGDPATGKVGWINVKEYYEIIFNVSQRPTLQSVFVKINEKPDKNGKYEIIVYKNGKKLNKKEAAKVMQEVNTQQRYMRKRFRIMQQQINQLFDQSMEDFDNLDIMAPWLDINRDRIMSPVIIFVRPKGK